MSSAVVEKTKPSTLKLPDPLANAQLRARKVALITGITGQDGSYLSEFLLERGYIIHGIIRRSSTFNTGRIEHLYTDKKLAGSFYLHYGDLSDTTNLVNIVAKIHPDEIYNLGAQSHVQVSFEMAEYTGDVDGLGTLRLLDAIPSTSELYGKVRETPQKETTPFYPRSPYAVAKQYAYWIVVNYREAYKMFAVNGILFNHESPRRGPTFVTRKTTRAVTRIARGLQDCLSLGNLDAQRDWGHARDYVEAMYLMLNNATEPTDYVVSSNQTHSVRKFVVKAFECVGINIRWEGTGVNEVGVDTKTGKILVRVDPKYFRPAEVDLLHGDSSKIQKELGWSLKVGFDDLVKEMIEADLRLLDETHDKSKQTVEVIAGKVEPPKIYGVVDVNKSVAGGVYSEHELEGRDANHDGVAFDNNFDYSKTPRILRNDGEQTFAGNMDLPGPSWAAIPDDDGPPRTTNKVALLTGITGQDGSYLAEFLLNKGYTVHGLIRRSSSFNTGRIEHLYVDPHTKSAKLFLHYGDLTDSTNLVHIIGKIRPDEIYNLAAQSHVQVSFEMAEYTGDVDGLGTLRLLDAIRTCGLTKKTKFYQASTSELYGWVRETPQKETTPFYPRSPYAVAKQYAYWIIVNYREAYGMFASNGILFNHESPRRGPTFVTRKTTRAVARIVKGLQECLYLGNLDAQRDWGHARDYVEGMWAMLQIDKPDDYVLSSGRTTSVRIFVEKAFKACGVDIQWKGSGVEEIGVDTKTGKVLVRVDPKYFRPTEVDLLLGDCSKARRDLQWDLKIDLDNLVKEMMEADLEGVQTTHLKW